MGLGEGLSGFYIGIEDKWFGMLDWLDGKGVPVYKYSDFLENHGIPSFPFTIGLIVLIAFLCYGLFFVGNAIDTGISINISNQFGEDVSGAVVAIKNAQGAELSKQTISSGSVIKLSRIPIGSIITVSAEKEGYSPDSYELEISKETHSVSLTMEQETEMIDAKLLLQDNKSNDAVKGARVVATYRNITREAASNSSGLAVLTQLPEGTDITIEIISDAYETISNNFKFSKGETKTILLSPKSLSLTGKSRLAITIKDEAGNLVKGADITIRDKSNDSAIYEDTSATGEYSADIEKGTSIRITVEKSGFLRYDSQAEGETRTMRLDEEPWQVTMKTGGKNFTIKAATESGLPITGAVVQLYSADGTIFLDSKQTGTDGSTEFADLNSGKFIATAYSEGYLPARQEIDAAAAGEATIKLKSADATNSSYAAVYVTDSMLAMANNTDLFFFEKIGGRELPLGIPPMKTDLSGYASARVQIGTSMLVKAVRATEEGSGEKTIQANTLNEIHIQLGKSATIVELSVLDESGLPVEGKITIRTAEGDMLYDGNIGTDGKVFFDSLGKTSANVEVTAKDGKTFSEQVSLTGNGIVAVKLGGDATGIEPEVKFLGIFNAEGTQVEGIVPGEYFWLKFETTWPSGNYKGGLHVRIGQDDVKFVDSEEAGIMGFDAVGAGFTVSKSYQPSPEPGNETADRQNKASLGEYGKWIELAFDNPKNTTVAKIKIKARESILAEQVEMHYRAWGEIGGKIYRNPADSVLGTNKYIPTKTGLYAETNVETIKVVQSLPECKKDLCASYYFLKKSGEIIEAKDFRPVLNETYSLEIDLSSRKEATATISLETGIPALLYFTGHELDSFQNTPEGQAIPVSAETNLSDANAGVSSGYLSGAPYIKETNNADSGAMLLFAGTATAAEAAAGTGTSGGYLYEAPATTPAEQANPYGFAENSKTDTKIKISSVQLSPGQTRKIRVYFKTVDAGDAFIKSEITAPGAALQKTFNFTIPKEKLLEITISPEEITAGKDFTVTVKDKATQDPVPNATLHFNDSAAKLALSIIGDGSKGRGLNGNYEIKNSLDPGKYLLNTSAPDFTPAETEITVATDNLLQIAKEIKINIPLGSAEASKTENVKNKGGQDVSALTYEIETGSNFPEEFSISVELPAAIAAKQSGQAAINVALNLTDESDESLHGEADLTIKGTVAGQFPTKTKSKIIIDYNKKFPEDCLKFDTSEVRIKLVGRQGSSSQAQVEIENTCETKVTLTPKIEPKQADPNLQVNVQPVTIEKDAKQIVQITAANTIDRMYSMQQTFSYNVLFDSPQVSRNISLKIELWNPVANLAFPPQVNLWLGSAQVQGQGMMTDSEQLYLRNTGREPITAFRMAVDDSAYRQYGIVAYLAPMSGEYGYLPPGGVLSPTRSIVAQTTNTVPLQAPAMGSIYYTGVSMGRQMDFGMTTVSVNYPGNQCLKLSGKGSVVFQSKQAYGLQRQSIIVRNECGEDVRIREIKPRSIGNNALYLIPPDTTIANNSEQEFFLQVQLAQQMQKQEQIRVAGWLVRSSKWIESNPLAIRIEIGDKTTSTGKEPQGSKIKMKVCGSDAEKEIAFPKLGDCTNGYCDAKTLSEKLAQKLKEIVKKARDKAETMQNRADNLPCKDQAYCTLSDLGIKAESFDVYSQLDEMTPELMKDTVFGKKITEIENYAVQKRTDIVDEDALGRISGGAFEQYIYLGGEFKGCGKYTFSIYGTVQVIGNQISRNNFMFLIKPEKIALDKEDILTATASCDPKIQNMANFLPIDDGLNSNDYHKAWPGIVAYGSRENSALGEAIAKQLFKAENGRAVDNGAGKNSLNIIIGDNENKLVKLSIEQVSGNNPRTITANVIQSAATNTKIASEIASAINAFKSGSPSKDTCISEDESYVLVQSYTAPTAPLAITGPETIKILGGETSIELTVHGDLLDKVKITTDFLEKAGRTGIEYIKITDGKGKLLLKQNADGSTEGTNELSLSQDKQAAGTPETGGTAKTAGNGKEETALLADAAAAPAGTSAEQALQEAIKVCTGKKQGDNCLLGTIKGKCQAVSGKLACTPEEAPAANPATGTPAAGETAQQAQPAAPEPATNASAKIKVTIKGSTNPEAPYVLAPETVKSIKINAEPADAGQKSRGTRQAKEIRIEACGIHVADFVKKMDAITPEIINSKPDKKITAYATIGWKGNPDKLDLDYLRGKLEAQLATSNAEQQIGARPGSGASANPTFRAGMAAKALFGLIAYVVPCSLVSLAWGAVTKAGLGGIWDVGFNCVMPASWAAKNFIKDLGPAGKTAGEGFDSVIRQIPLIGSWLVGKEPSTDPAQLDSFKENILGPAELGISIDSTWAAVSNSAEMISPASAKIAAAEQAEKLKKYLLVAKFNNSTAPEITALVNEIGAKFQAGVESKIMLKYAGGSRLIGETIEASCTEAMGETIATKEIAEKIILARNAAGKSALPKPINDQYTAFKQNLLAERMNPEAVGKAS
ncbi:MAG: carboxypeptidase regulatory-like domain-containing protein, partial [Candidatus ainarchaeum sp.]|nr:carboxypeptidase regulatory-like domain-containing protein [Candidatus ainarchaeum sp.]